MTGLYQLYDDDYITLSPTDHKSADCEILSTNFVTSEATPLYLLISDTLSGIKGYQVASFIMPISVNPFTLAVALGTPLITHAGRFSWST